MTNINRKKNQKTFNVYDYFDFLYDKLIEFLIKKMKLILLV